MESENRPERPDGPPTNPSTQDASVPDAMTDGRSTTGTDAAGTPDPVAADPGTSDAVAGTTGPGTDEAVAGATDDSASTAETDAAHTSTGLPIGDTAASSGTGVKVGIGVLAGAVLVGGAIVGIAMTGGNEDTSGDSASTADTEDITGFDFANTEMTDGSGTTFRLVDGFYQAPDQPDTVGYHLVGDPVFADVDGDGDLDAATLLQWAPAAGSATSVALVWLWDNGTVRQLDYPIRTDYQDRLSELVAVDDGFSVTASMRGLSGEETTETFTVGYADGFPVQIAPVFGSVNRCPLFDGEESGTVGDGTVPLVAPDDAAPPLGEADDITATVAVPTELTNTQWTVVRATRTDGTVSCGWLPTDHLVPA